MKFFNIEPRETIIFEDSSVGIEAARKSGAGVFCVNKF
ncbi:HAD superfamily hydrolase (TIGR01509 family) [Clostridium beijerinckii]|nr:HAD superfamily hydrolase (TIGR01509 family) [Clostridium beijerinckii]